MAEVAGFEPTNNGVKVRCVTASPHLNIEDRLMGIPPISRVW